MYSVWSFFLVYFNELKIRNLKHVYFLSLSPSRTVVFPLSLERKVEQINGVQTWTRNSHPFTFHIILVMCNRIRKKNQEKNTTKTQWEWSTVKLVYFCCYCYCCQQINSCISTCYFFLMSLLWNEIYRNCDALSSPIIKLAYFRAVIVVGHNDFLKSNKNRVYRITYLLIRFVKMQEMQSLKIWIDEYKMG